MGSNFEIKIKKHTRYVTIINYGWPETWPSGYDPNSRILMLNARAKWLEKVGITVRFLIALWILNGKAKVKQTLKRVKFMSRHLGDI